MVHPRVRVVLSVATIFDISCGDKLNWPVPRIRKSEKMPQTSNPCANSQLVLETGLEEMVVSLTL